MKTETTGKHIVSVKYLDKFSVYTMDFKDDKHFDNWLKKIKGKLVGIEKI